MRKLARYFLILLGIGLIYTSPSKSASTYQIKPALSGTWALDLSLSGYSGDNNKNLADYKSDLVYDELILIITQQEPELKITRKIIKNKRERVEELVYYTDNRGEKNPGITTKVKITSKTIWEGDRLVTNYTLRDSFNGDFYSCDVTDSWELSPDGQTLIYSTLSSAPKNMYGRSPAGLAIGPPIKRVFKRVA